MIPESLIQVGIAGAIAISVVGFMMKMLMDYHKLVTNHITHNTEALNGVKHALDENSKMLDVLTQWLLRKYN